MSNYIEVQTPTKGEKRFYLLVLFGLWVVLGSFLAYYYVKHNSNPNLFISAPIVLFIFTVVFGLNILMRIETKLDYQGVYLIRFPFMIKPMFIGWTEINSAYVREYSVKYLQSRGSNAKIEFTDAPHILVDVTRIGRNKYLLMEPYVLNQNRTGVQLSLKDGRYIFFDTKQPALINEQIIKYLNRNKI